MMRSDAPSPGALTLGEALVDLVPRADDRWAFDARPGGAPANVAVGLARHGRSAGLIGRIGADALGDYVLETMARAGVYVGFVQRDLHHPTPVTVVQPGASDAHRYVLYREGAADGALSAEELPDRALGAARLLHVGTLSLSRTDSRAATLRAVTTARRHGVLVSVDVNLRAPAWSSTERMVGAGRELLALADVAKVTREEAELLADAAGRLPVRAETVVLTTDGAGAARLTLGDLRLQARPPAVEVVDASGAGDAFMAGFLHRLLASDARPGALSRTSADQLTDALVFAARAGASAVRVIGAMTQG